MRVWWLIMGWMLAAAAAMAADAPMPEYTDERSTAELETATKAGDIRATTVLAWRLANGHLVAHDRARAVALWTRAAEAGDARAMVHLGTAYSMGRGVARDIAAGMAWELKAAEAGDPVAMGAVSLSYRWGYLAYDLDLAKAEAWARRGIAAGSLRAAINLADMMKEGWGVEKDEEAARVLVEKALADMEARPHLEVDDMIAISDEIIYGYEDLGYSYRDAMDMAKRAGDTGDLDGMLFLAQIYDYDDMPASAYRLYRQAAERGSSQAMAAIGEMIVYGLSEKRAKTTALEAFEAAIEMGYVPTYNKMGFMYVLEDDPDEAFICYLKGAELGDADAMANLAELYEEGNGVEKDLAIASSWYAKAADLGNDYSAWRLAVMYEDEAGENADPAELMRLHRRAALMGDGDSMYRVYQLLPDDPEHAVERELWLQRASEWGSGEAWDIIYEREEAAEQDDD